MSHLSGIKNPPVIARKRLGESRGAWVSKPSVHWLSSMDTLARRFERLVVVGVWLELFPKSGLQRTNSGRLLSEFRPNVLPVVRTKLLTGYLAVGGALD